MNFTELLQRLEDRLGRHQLPLNAAASGIKNVFEGCPLHHELMTRLVQAIYRENACRRLHDPVRRVETFRALEPIRLQALRAPSTDIDVYRLLEELCAAVNEVLEDGPSSGAAPRASRPAGARVIPLDAFRHRRYLKSWA